MSVAVRKLLKKLLICLLILIGLFFLRWGWVSCKTIPGCPFCWRSHVIHNYYRAVGINQRIHNKDINETISVLGEPTYIEKELVLEGKTLYWVFLHYDGFSILFQTEDFEKYEYCGFELYSPEMKIRWDIHVGSTREQIVHAYRECPSLDAWRVNGYKEGDCVCDNGYKNHWRNSLEFTYDENDIVTCIRYLPNF